MPLFDPDDVAGRAKRLAEQRDRRVEADRREREVRALERIADAAEASTTR